MSRAVLFVKRNRPRTFKLIKSLDAILIYQKRGYENQLFYKERIWVCKTQTVLESSLAYLASLLVHEAEHLRQHDGGKRAFGSRAEGEAYRAQRRFLKSTGTKEEVMWLDSLYKKKWWVRRTSDGKATLFTRSQGPFNNFVALYLSKKLHTRPLKEN